MSNLNSSLGEFGPLSQLLPCVDIGVVRAFEGSLQLLQLLGCEGGATAPLLPLQRQAWLRVHVGGLVRVTGWSWGKQKAVTSTVSGVGLTQNETKLGCNKT